MVRPTRVNVDLKPIAKRIVFESLNGTIATLSMESEYTEDYVEQMIEAMKHSRHLGGYELARYLDEACGWEIDASVVSILDETYWEVQNAVTELVKKWVKGEDIKPLFKVGDIRKYKDRSGKYDGEILRVEEDVAEYLICVAALGQKKISMSGFVVAFEVLEADND